MKNSETLDRPEIPAQLIYEMDETPIYYSGYQEVLRGDKKLEEIMGSSFLQSFVISLLMRYLIQHLPESYQVLTNELGLQFAERKWRAVDMAIYEAAQLQEIELTAQYLNAPPKVVIEVDTQANLTTFADPISYYSAKINALLDFGVETVLWIFTDAQKFMIARPNQDWIIRDWKNEMPILEGVQVNLLALLQQAKMKWRQQPG